MAARSSAQDDDRERVSDILLGLGDHDRARAMDNLREFIAILREWDREASEAGDTQD